MNKLTWSNVEEEYFFTRIEEYEELCANSKASDFYFDVREYGITFVTITPKDHFDQVGHCWDQSINLDHILPEHLVEEDMECTWSSEESVALIKKELLNLGFMENAQLTVLINECGDFEE